MSDLEDIPPVKCKMMKTVDGSKTEVILYFLFEDSNYTNDQLISLALTLLNQKIGWTPTEKFSQILEEAHGPKDPKGHLKLLQ